MLINTQNGSLAVQDGRSVAPFIDSLLKLPSFATRIATQDFHPQNHISFASNHPAPNNKPFESSIDMNNPAPGKEAEVKEQRLWPVHCVAGTKGAEIIPEIDSTHIDAYVRKGMDARVEMYSAFADAFGNLDPSVRASSVDVDIASCLREKNVTDVFVVGLAGDYCVKHTAIDAAKVRFKSWIIEDGTKCVDPGSGWQKTKDDLKAAGVSVIGKDSDEMLKLKTSA